ncbi:MAG: hypothetical protein HY905_17010 [Deltaproteobacteria bacterium]|nr:hypothetical protein [Deltaproteobacteria bacterium]
MRLRGEILRRTPSAPDVLFAFAGAAYRALRPDLGDPASDRAAALCAEPCAERPDGLDNLRAASRRLSESPAPASLEDFLALAESRTTLGHNDEARRLLAAAATAYPADARTFVGQARVLIQESGDLVAAAAILEGAGPDNRDDDYWAILSVGLLTSFLFEVLPDLLDDQTAARAASHERLVRLQETLTRYAEFHPDLAAAPLTVVRAVLRGLDRIAAGEETKAVLRSELDAWAADAVATARTLPPSREREALLLGVAIHAPACDQAVAALDASSPTSAVASADDDHLPWRVTAEIGTAARCGRPERLAVAESLLELVPPAETAGEAAAQAAALAADVSAANGVFGLGDQSAAVTLLSRAAEDEALAPTERARLRNNLAVLYVSAGDHAAAADLFRRSEDEARDDGKRLAHLNRMALPVLAADPSPEAVAAAQEAFGFAAEDDRAAAVVRSHARRWFAWVVHRWGADPSREARASAYEADANESGDGAAGTEAAAERGVMVFGSFVVGFGYESRGRIVLTMGGRPELWLALPTP